MTDIPAGVDAMGARGPEWRRWVDELEGVTRNLLQQWELRQDGDATGGSGSLVLPVRTADATPAVLKISFPHRESEHEHLVLRRWGGDGAVRLLRADPHRRTVLLERLHQHSLETRPAIEACEVVAGLYGRLHVPALPQLRTLTSHVEQWSADFAALPRSAPIPHRLVDQAMALSRALAADSASAGSVIHGDLHYASVLAADREPWLAIAPKPMNGDPHYELAPMLWHRWAELTGRIREGVRIRFYTLVDAAGLDEERARAWAVVRVVHAATTELRRGRHADATQLTRYVTLAKAMQD